MPADRLTAPLPRQPVLVVTILLAILILLLPSAAHAMRCGTRLISAGDIQARVLRYCGEPVQTSQSLAYRAGIYPDRRTTLTLSADSATVAGREITRQRVRHYGHSEVVVERWIYNLGPRQLMREITFENGVVVKVATMGYGYTAE